MEGGLGFGGWRVGDGLVGGGWVMVWWVEGG